MDIILSKELKDAIAKVGELVKSDPRYSEMVKVSEEYSSNKELNDLLDRYGELQRELAEEYGSADFSDEKVKALQKDMDEIYGAVSSNPSYVAFRQASEEYSDFTEALYAELEYAVTGKRPVECTHDCSTCGGCC